ncbi:Immunogenic protein MPT70 precursor [Symmachiella macrocystis]|uniref:Immunogenic protein MPT70 n=1 Tax=Symmachiella macrocystis TaxID=2527985 RepID=A0A5C6BRH3_9PLAN|nr:fasciclin domain-containing protein [Symmachiella macrocystis]TWU14322.1 Immunogenic protein MPT70 precursor [Symmachiella macrocystis]
MRILLSLSLVGLTWTTAVAGNCPNSRPVQHTSPQRVAYYNPAPPAAAAKKSKQADIVDTAVKAESFKTLVAAVKAAGLVEALKSDGSFTVFAPTDKAFAKLPEGTIANLLKPENKKTLQAILKYHVVAGKVAAKDVVKLSKAKTLQGDDVAIAVAGGKVKVNNANVVKTDIVCSNGIIHVIDAVILPPEKTPEASNTSKAKADVVDTAVAAGSFKTLVAAVKAAGLVETLKGDGPFTVFTPTDKAFAKLPKGTVEDLLKPENREQLQAILTYHVVSGRVMAADVVKLQSAKTVNGESVSIATKDGQVHIDEATVVKADIECANGVIHVIDAVMLP